MFEKHRFIINESSIDSPISIKQKNKDTVEFVTVLQEAGSINRNGRIYPKAVLEQGINSPYIREKIADGTLMGEVNHPADNSVQRQMSIDLNNVSFRILEMWFEGNLLKGRCQTLNNAKGRDMMGLIEQGCKLSFSLRAQGNVHDDPMTGARVVDPGIQICTWDWVATASHANAKILNICEETMKALCGKFGTGMVALTEAADFCAMGQLIDTTETVLKETVDYSRHFNEKLKRLSEMYLPEAGDNVISIGNRETLIENGNVVKKVMTEDFLMKDIRSKILALSETETFENEDILKDIVVIAGDMPESVDADNEDLYNDETEVAAQDIATEEIVNEELGDGAVEVAHDDEKAEEILPELTNKSIFNDKTEEMATDVEAPKAE